LDTFASRLLQWFELNGRHDLPWQQGRNLYRVWVAEIMLQQTQVMTVIPYYRQFMQIFPDITVLAKASVDEVLAQWAGLGYYRRARHLHKTAEIILAQYQGEFPQDYEAVLALPGIGPSTAGAILAQALDQRHPILDGNVKRVLSRYHAIEGWPGQRHIEKQLWQKAEQHTPITRLVDYTQAMMDLGATLCTRSSPQCQHCPLNSDCVALATRKVDILPTKKSRKALPVRKKRFLVIHHPEIGLLMEKRPTTGIWGGLWSLPEMLMDDNIEQSCMQRWGIQVDRISELPAFRHSFSHFHLDISPCVIAVKAIPQQISEAQTCEWQALALIRAVATPVRYILDQLASELLGKP